MKTKIQKRKMKKSNSKKTRKNKHTKLSGGNNKSSKQNVHGHDHKRHNKSVKLQKLNCSPKPKNEINHFSCYTNKTLLRLRDLWNARHPDAKINTNSPKEIHKRISEMLGGVCNKESCWLKQKGEFGKIEGWGGL